MNVDQDVHLVRLETPVTRLLTYRTFVALVDGLMIDSGFAHARGRLLKALEGRVVEQVVNTHSHEDHAGNNAEIARRFKAEVYAPAEGLDVLAQPEQQVWHLYQRVIWGIPAPNRARPVGAEVRTRRFRFTVVRTPGHSRDHVCYFEQERGWLFGGDLFLGPKVRVARPFENAADLIDSLERVIALEPRILFCYHRGAIEKPLELLRLKRDFLLELREKVQRLHATGVEPEEITRRVLGREPLGYRIVTRGDLSSRNLIRALLKAPGEG